jgi:hypothetical protein
MAGLPALVAVRTVIRPAVDLLAGRVVASAEPVADAGQGGLGLVHGVLAGGGGGGGLF